MSTRDQDYRSLADLREEIEDEIMTALLAGNEEGAARLKRSRTMVHDAIGRMIGAPIRGFLATLPAPTPSAHAVRSTLRGSEGM